MGGTNDEQQALKGFVDFHEKVESEFIVKGDNTDNILQYIPKSIQPFLDDNKISKEKALHKTIIYEGRDGSDTYFIFPEVNANSIILDDKKTYASKDIDKVYIIFKENRPSSILVKNHEKKQPVKDKVVRMIKDGKQVFTSVSTDITISHVVPVGIKQSRIKLPRGGINEINILWIPKEELIKLNKIEDYAWYHMLHKLSFNVKKDSYETLTGYEIKTRRELALSKDK